MTIGWQFPLNAGGSAQGFSDGAIDTFSGRRLSSLVREVIQNSLDAVDTNAEAPVTVEFSLAHLEKDELSDLQDLSRHFDKCSEMAKLQKLPTAQDFHDTAAKTIRKSSKVPVLAISDSNTKGLSGPIDDTYGPWFALTKGTGITQKSAAGSLGSFGHGSKAPFAMGLLRTVYYLSKTINPDGEDELRFQGKSILQSHRHPDSDETTQGTGFFGVQENLKPILNSEIPKWAVDLRSAHSDGYGTTILIPHARFRDDLFPETIITVVANFFYAIFKNNLRVIVDGEEINQQNIIDKFEWCKSVIEHEQDEIDHDHVLNCFKSIETIINPTFDGHQEIPNFGRIDWFLRLGDDFNYKAVAISRESGMLITRKPTRLEIFRNKKPFDMFVFVNAGDGSRALKRLENPAHDNFEFDRVQDSNDEASVTKLYKAMVDKIRAVLDNYAAIDTADEVQLSELSQLMFELGTSEERSENTERGGSMYISKGAVTRVKPQVGGGAGAAGVMTTQGQNHGQGSGAGTGVKGNRGNTPGGGTKTVEVVGGKEGVVKGSSSIQVANLRMSRAVGAKNPRLAKVSFTVFSEGAYSFQLYKSGETDQGVVTLLKDGKPTSAYSLNFDEPGRKSLIVEVENKEDLEYALEGWIDV